MPSKYTPEVMIPALRSFAEARNKALQRGFTDNGGAIHSVERILEILCRSICLPDIVHPKDISKSLDVEISVLAHEAREAGDWPNVQIEHVMPQRAFARNICESIGSMTDAQVIKHIKATYRIVLLTKAERRQVDSINRSKMTADRIAEAGIKLRSAG